MVQVNNGCSATQLTGFAMFSKLTTGYGVTTFISRDPAGVCQSYQISGFVDSDLETVDGVFDNLPRTFGGDGDNNLSRTWCCPYTITTPDGYTTIRIWPGIQKEEE